MPRPDKFRIRKLEVPRRTGVHWRKLSAMRGVPYAGAPGGKRPMPSYEYRCNDCGRTITLRYKTYADYDAATHTCPHCGSTALTRLISRVAISKSTVSRMMAGDWDDDSALSELDDADPRTMGRVLREMSAEVGEDIGPEFEEVVTRLERGESPDDIEASLPDPPDDAAPGGAFGGDATSALGGDTGDGDL